MACSGSHQFPSDLKQLPKPAALTRGDAFTVGSFAWSPDGRRITFDAQRDPDLGSSQTGQIYLLDLADLHVKKLFEGDGPNSNPKWSQDGKQIAYVTSSGSASPSTPTTTSPSCPMAAPCKR